MDSITTARLHGHSDAMDELLRYTLCKMDDIDGVLRMAARSSAVPNPHVPTAQELSGAVGTLVRSLKKGTKRRSSGRKLSSSPPKRRRKTPSAAPPQLFPQLTAKQRASMRRSHMKDRQVEGHVSRTHQAANSMGMAAMLDQVPCQFFFLHPFSQTNFTCVI